ncbi:MAG: hypothetical protein ING19_08155, partial [Azospirillum sp.]|nr:hypothetical protein [Azospirillum sp.]
MNVVNEVSAAVAAVDEETVEAANAVNAVLTVEPDATVSVEAEVSARNVLAVELFDSRLVP